MKTNSRKKTKHVLGTLAAVGILAAGSLQGSGSGKACGPARGGIIGKMGAAFQAAVSLVTGAPLVDFGDAPDDNPACEAGAVITGKYPTRLGTTNAAGGRTSPQHTPLGLEDFSLGGSPTTEPDAFQPACDWLTGLVAPAPPPCDLDDGPVVLCLSPTCNSGVAVTPGGPCGKIAGTCFGPPPPTPTLGFWVFDVTTGPLATAKPRFANVAVDWNLSGRYGDIGLEWPMQDAAIPFLPGGSQMMITTPFPVITVAPTGPPLGWEIFPFWTRFLVSDEQIGPAFPAGNWDGSGQLGGYKGGETEDWVVECDPRRRKFPDCNRNNVPDNIDMRFGRLHDNNRNGVPDECESKPQDGRSQDGTHSTPTSTTTQPTVRP